MTGAEIIGALLRDNSAGTAPVAAANIKGSRLPDNVALPALLVRNTSTVERQHLRRGSLVHTVDRVSVTVRARSYVERRDIMLWVRQRCAGRIGSIAGASGIAILTAGTGPELDGPGDTFERTQDFRVSYNAPGSETGYVPPSSGGSSGGTPITVGGSNSIDGLDWAP